MVSGHGRRGHSEAEPDQRNYASVSRNAHMARDVQWALLGLVGVVAAVIYLGMTVYPFQYGFAESAVLAGAFVLFALFESVLDRSSF